MTKVPKDLYKTDDFTVTVTEDSREPQVWRILNDAPFEALSWWTFCASRNFTSYIVLSNKYPSLSSCDVSADKKDSETGDEAQGDATLEGATYGLYAAEDIKYPDGTGGAGCIIKHCESSSSDFYFWKRVLFIDDYAYRFRIFFMSKSLCCSLCHLEIPEGYKDPGTVWTVKPEKGDVVQLNVENTPIRCDVSADKKDSGWTFCASRNFTSYIVLSNKYPSLSSISLI